ncbi:MAG: hypothetical protein WC325_10395 [Candidatus Bathyarchaeia archaeon]
MNKNVLEKSQKSITRTFRIREEWDSTLQEEAANQGVSVNVLLNKILRKYSLFSRWNDRNKGMSLSQRALRAILTTVNVNGLNEAGTTAGGLDAINIVNALGLPMEYESFVYLITEYFGGPSFARWFQCFYHQQGTKDVFHLQHDFGNEWSIFLEKYLIAFLSSITDTEATTRVYDYAVTLTVTRPKSKFIIKPE